LLCRKIFSGAARRGRLEVGGPGITRGRRPRFPSNPNPKPIGIYRCNRAVRQVVFLVLDDIVALFSLPASRNSDQAQETGSIRSR